MVIIMKKNTFFFYKKIPNKKRTKYDVIALEFFILFIIFFICPHKRGEEGFELETSASLGVVPAD
jgi:hypothetical protein